MTDDQTIKNLTRREWLVGSAALTGGLFIANTGAAQSVTVNGYVPTPENPIRMSSNENPYGISIAARNAITDAFDIAHLYGGAGRQELVGHLAKMEGIGEENIIFSAGSGEILKTMGLITAMEGGNIMAAHPTFGNLTRYAEDKGSQIIRVPVNDKMEIDLDAMRAAYTDDVKLIYISNPNNPIPTILEKNALKEFCLEMAEKCYVFIDEAYHEFVDNPDYETMVPLAAANKNIIVARTASKIHGFAGVRVGLAYASAEIIQKIRQYMTGSISSLALLGAVASYKDTETQKFVLRKNKEALQIVYNLFDKHNIRYIKSNSNFLFYESGIDVEEVRARYLKHGIQVGRPYQPFTKWCRVSMAKPEDMEYFSEVFEKEFLS